MRGERIDDYGYGDDVDDDDGDSGDVGGGCEVGVRVFDTMKKRESAALRLGIGASPGRGDGWYCLSDYLRRILSP